METPEHFRAFDRVEFTKDVVFGIPDNETPVLKGSQATVLKYWPERPYYTIMLDDPPPNVTHSVNCPDYVLKLAP